jgi:hypothetical protein
MVDIADGAEIVFQTQLDFGKVFELKLLVKFRRQKING